MAALLLVVLAAGYLRQRALRLHAADPTQAQFFGAPAMALLTVGAGALQFGQRMIGARAALDVGLGPVVARYRARSRHRRARCRT